MRERAVKGGGLLDCWTLGLDGLRVFVMGWDGMRGGGGGGEDRWVPVF